MKKELIEIATDLDSGFINEKQARTLLLGLLGVSGSACSKCKDSSFDTEYKNVGSKIYWSEHDEIENISKFTRNDRYYSSDRIDKECIVKSCNSCGYKQAVSCS
jgi:hypothetical protein